MSTTSSSVEPPSPGETDPDDPNRTNSENAVKVLLELPPSDDSGAQTADRYDWQAAMATADALALQFQCIDGVYSEVDSSKIQIICEFHEDWIIQIDQQVELVSAKHRDLQIGAWRSAGDLVDKGGLGHLFSRWTNAQQLPNARLVTNAAVASGEAESIAKCHKLLGVHSSTSRLSVDDATDCSQAIDTFCRSVMMLAKGLPSEWVAPDGVRKNDLNVPNTLIEAGFRFLRILRIDQKRPNRADIAHSAPSLYAEPLAMKMGLNLGATRAIWETVLSLIRVKMRARGEGERGGLPIVGGVKGGSFSEELKDQRGYNLKDIQIAVETCARHPKAFELSSFPRRLTRLSTKMAMGRCADTSIERAEKLRLDYVRYRRERKNAAPGNVNETRKIDNALHRIADEETQMVRSYAEGWGADLWNGLSARFSPDQQLSNGIEIEGDLALGGVCQLTQDCQVWFSDGFDVDGTIKQIKAMKDDRSET